MGGVAGWRMLSLLFVSLFSTQQGISGKNRCEIGGKSEAFGGELGNSIFALLNHEFYEHKANLKFRLF